MPVLYVIQVHCDGTQARRCGENVAGLPVERPNSAEVQRAARARGWRFTLRETKYGRIKTAHCPRCAAELAPPPKGKRP